MTEDAPEKLAELIRNGRELVDELSGQDAGGWVDFGEVDPYERWLGSTGQLLLTLGGPQSEIFGRFRDIVNEQRNPVGVQVGVVRKVFDLVLAVFEEVSCGSLRRFEDIVAAPILDDLLDEAERHREGERKLETMALVSAVLEHTLKRLCAQHHIDRSGKSLQALAEELAESPAFGEQSAQWLRSAVAICSRSSTEQRLALASRELTAAIDDTRRLVSGLT
jgi:hypothetical protein